MTGRRDRATGRAALLLFAVGAGVGGTVLARQPAAPAPGISATPAISAPPAVTRPPAGASTTASTPAPAPRRAFGLPVAEAVVVRRFPHDPRAFTQGLLWHRGRLYESLGQPGESEVRRVRLESGAVEARSAIPADQFGEGLARVGQQLISLTWQDGIAYRWDLRTLRQRGEARYPGEGWGLTEHDGRLILSDGTATLRIIDPTSFAETARVPVTAGGRPLSQLNELEMVEGELWANIWRTDYIARIDPATGQVRGFVDLRPLAAEITSADPDAVLNGIAYDPASRRLFVTGKRWPTLFEIRLR